MGKTSRSITSLGNRSQLSGLIAEIVIILTDDWEVEAAEDQMTGPVGNAGRPPM